MNADYLYKCSIRAMYRFYLREDLVPVERQVTHENRYEIAAMMSSLQHLVLTQWVNTANSGQMLLECFNPGSLNSIELQVALK